MIVCQIYKLKQKINHKNTGITPQLKMTVNSLVWEVSLKVLPANKTRSI